MFCPKARYSFFCAVACLLGSCGQPLSQASDSAVDKVITDVLRAASALEETWQDQSQNLDNIDGGTPFLTVSAPITSEKKRLDGSCSLSARLHTAPLPLILRSINELCGSSVIHLDLASAQLTGDFNRLDLQEFLGVITDLAGAHLLEHDGGVLAVSTSSAVQEQHKHKAKVLEEIKLRHTKVESVLPKLVERFTSTDAGLIWLQDNARNNSILVEAPPHYIDRVRAHIHLLDNIEPLFLVEAWLLEVSEAYSRQLGIDVQASTNIDSDTISIGGGVTGDKLVDLSNSDDDTGLAVGRLGKDLLLQLTGARSTQASHVLSHPRIYTLQGREASLFQGEEIPYTTQTDNQVHTQFQRAGLSLQVKPYLIHKSLHQSLVDIEVTINRDSVPTNSGQNIARREIRTNLQLPLEAVAVISGIRTDRQVRDERGWSGTLAHGYDRDDGRAQILILLTVSLIRGGGKSVSN